MVLLLTLIVAAPVLHAPSDRLFGMETVGRHHDPFTAMAHFAAPAAGGAYVQPATDWPGRLLSSSLGPVAGYNVLVLLTFPLSAAAAYLLARHLAIPHGFALAAAAGFAFAPFHLAQAAYHPHIAQTQWMPLYLLALWRALDRGTPGAMIGLALAIAAVALSNFYAGLVAAITTPAALLTYWATASRHQPRGGRHLLIVSTTLLTMVGAGIAYLVLTAHPVTVIPWAFGYPADDLARYGARWWSYLVPPLAHPLLGERVAALWTRAAVHEGRLEQQITLGAGLVALACVALVAWGRRTDRSAPLVFVPVLAAVAAVAFVCSLAPHWTPGTAHLSGPAGLIHQVLPMFRAYARFGVLVQLMIVLLAAIGAQRLWISDRRPVRVACLALLAAAAAEYVVWPPSLARDVLPTTAHRWVVDQPGPLRVLDCSPLTVESGSVGWLTGERVLMRSGAFDECAAPEVAGRLVAEGYSHMLVRQGTVEARWIRAAGAPPGLVSVARLRDGEVFAVSGPPASVYTARVNGFYQREYEGTRTWQWMGPAATWEVVNTGTRTVIATPEVELAAFGRARHLRLRLNQSEAQLLAVSEARALVRLAPIVLTPGRHTLTFEPVEAPSQASPTDQRELSFAVGAWRWAVPASYP